MKRKRSVKGFGYEIAISLLFALLVCTGCLANPSNATESYKSQAKTDSIMRKAVGDSIYNIITNAKKVVAEEIKMTVDSTKVIVRRKSINVKTKYIPLAQFIVSDPKIYVSNLTSYGKFFPCFKLTFTKKKEKCILNFDFGLKKWNVCDSKGKQIKMYDLPSDDMLRLANMLFPENDLYKNLINTDKR